MSDAQLETINGISPRGFRIASGEPCECGPDEYRTSKKRGYSDSMIYTHTCGECGNEFKTWIEG